MATDVDGIYADWGTPQQRRLETVTPEELRAGDFASGSMGPKVEAAIRFVELTGRRAAIGALQDIEGIVEGTAGTNVVPAGFEGAKDSTARRLGLVRRLGHLLRALPSGAPVRLRPASC